jgi:aminopeptidase YwaD
MPVTTSAVEHLERLCAGPDRRPGSPSNLAASAYVRDVLAGQGWDVEEQWFDCLDWSSRGGTVVVGGRSLPVVPSLYGTGVSAGGRLVAATTSDEVARSAPGDVLLLHGALTTRPLTPRHYPFYREEQDERLLDLLESVRPAAVIAITGRFPDMCGALDPFPFIEDGSFTVPAADVGPGLGQVLLAHVGEHVDVTLDAQRGPARAANVLARRGRQDQRVTVVAHVDSKPGTPGALDNGTGVAAVLLAAEALAGESFDREVGVEWLVVNGEDYYAASGEVRYLATADLDEVVLAVNLDGVGLPEGPTAWSAYACEGGLERLLRSVLSDRPGLVEGPPWHQSDHAVFALRGRPALAFTSSDMAGALGTVAHAPTDTPDRVAVAAVDVAAAAVAAVVRAVIERRSAA